MFTDTNLTGCYAMTGGSTVFTADRGEWLPATIDASQTSSVTMVTADVQTLTMACSDFLRVRGGVPSVALSFMKSPICTSYAQKYEQEFHNQSITDAPESDYPLGVLNAIGPNLWYCCGGCRFEAPDIGVLYWSTTATPDCSKVNGTITSQASLPSRSASVPAGTEASSFAVLNGSTLTFPSLYITFRGAVTVRDRCGIKGSIYKSPTIAVSLGGLTTLSYPSSALGADLGMTKGPYNPEACLTYGVSDPQLSSFWYAEVNSSVWTTTTDRTIGPPYNPIILPPQELINLDPEWKSCTEWYSQGVFAGFSYGLFDPPRALTPVASMSNPMATSAVLTTQSPAVTSKSPAQPANAPTTIITRSEINSEPPKSSLISALSSTASSYLGGSTIELQPSSIISLSSTSSISSGFDPAVSSAKSPSDITPIFAPTRTRPAVTALSNPDSGSSPSETSPLASDFTASAKNTAQDISIDPNAVQSGEQTADPVHSRSGHGLESKTQYPWIATEGGRQVTATLKGRPTSAGLGPAILSGLGITDSTTRSQQKTPQQDLPGTTVSSSVPTVSPIGESVISQGGITFTISGTHVSLGSAGLADDSETLSLDPMNPSAPRTAASTFAAPPKPSTITLASSRPSVGGALETVSGYPLSFAPSGTLVIGPDIDVPSLSVVTIAGQSFTANPEAVSSMGMTVSANVQGVLISGMLVSLASSGKFVISSDVATSDLHISTTAGQPLTANATVSSVNNATFAASGSSTTTSGSSISSSLSGSSISGGTAASFTSSTTAASPGSATAGSDGVTLSGTAVVLNPSETLLINSSGTLTLPSNGKSTATAVPKAGQPRVAVPRVGLLLALVGSAFFCSRRWTIS